MNWNKVYQKLKRAMKDDPFMAVYIKDFIMQCLDHTDKTDRERLKKIRNIVSSDTNL